MIINRNTVKLKMTFYFGRLIRTISKSVFNFNANGH